MQCSLLPHSCWLLSWYALLGEPLTGTVEQHHRDTIGTIAAYPEISSEGVPMGLNWLLSLPRVHLPQMDA